MSQSKRAAGIEKPTRPAGTNGELVIEDYAGVTLATIGKASLLDARDIQALARDLIALVTVRAKRKLVLDFTPVRQLSSQAIGMLLELHKQSKAIDGVVVLCGVNGQIRRLFELTKLDSLIRCYKDDAAALASFGVRVG